MMEPWADHNSAADTPSTPPAKIKNQRVPCVWKLVYIR